MTEPDTRIAEVEARIAELENAQEHLRDELMEARIDQWKGRIDDRDVQLHLASMEVRDRVMPFLSTLRDKVLDAQSRAADGASKANDVTTTMRQGIEMAFEDLRGAMRAARSELTT